MDLEVNFSLRSSAILASAERSASETKLAGTHICSHTLHRFHSSCVARKQSVSKCITLVAIRLTISTVQSTLHFLRAPPFIKLLCCFTLKRLRGAWREVAPSYSLVAGHINERQTSSSSPLVPLMNESGFIMSAQDRRSAGRREFGVIRRRQNQSARRSRSDWSLLSLSKERLCLGLITFPLFHYLRQCVFSQ